MRMRHADEGLVRLGILRILVVGVILVVFQSINRRARWFKLGLRTHIHTQTQHYSNFARSITCRAFAIHRSMLNVGERSSPEVLAC